MGGNVNIIAAVADNLAIGDKGKLLWHIPEDLKYFKSLTIGCPVVMGRKTFESLGRPLPGRLNIVVSRSRMSQANGGKERQSTKTDVAGRLLKNVVVKTSLEGAIEAAFEALKHINNQNSGCEITKSTERAEIFVIGGGEIYRQAMHFADRLYITQVHTSPQADAFFPEIDPFLWRKTSEGEPRWDEKSGLSYEFVTYDRRKNKDG